MPRYSFVPHPHAPLVQRYHALMAPLCKGGCQKSLISDWGIAPLFLRTTIPKQQSLRQPVRLTPPFAQGRLCVAPCPGAPTQGRLWASPHLGHTSRPCVHTSMPHSRHHPAGRSSNRSRIPKRRRPTGNSRPRRTSEPICTLKPSSSTPFLTAHKATIPRKTPHVKAFSIVCSIFRYTHKRIIPIWLCGIIPPSKRQVGRADSQFVGRSAARQFVQ